MKTDFAEKVWTRFKTQSPELRVIPSNNEQCVFMQEYAVQHKEGNVFVGDADKASDLEMLVSL